MKILKIATKVSFVLFSTTFALVMSGTAIANENYKIINQHLHQQDYEFVEEEKTQDSDYYTSDYDSIHDLCQDTQKKAQQVEEEGAVLLKNDNHTLPLGKGKKVTLFGYGGYEPAYGGSGSAASDNPMSEVTLKEGLEEEEITVNPATLELYANNKAKYAPSKYKINDAPWSDFNSISSSFLTYKDAAIMVIRRSRGENADPTLSSTACDGENGNYLSLNEKEKSILRGLGDSKGGTFSKVIVLLNSPNPMEMSFLDDLEYKIDAALWIGTVGQTGMRGIGRILSGSVNPSGSLPDTYYYHNKDNPAMANFGSFKYDNYSDYKSQLPAESDNSYTMMSYGSYVAYQENIYVGYRYPETRYEDVITCRDAVGDFRYQDTIAFPFGYGLSYTNFAYTDFQLTKEDQDYKVSVKVKNTGEVAGKDTLQIYLQKPYTTYDENNNVEKSAVELVGFTKTKELQPGDETIAEVLIQADQLTSYDAYHAKGYIRDEGDYYFTLGADAHDAINNILSKKNYSMANKMDAEGNKDLVGISHETFDDKAYQTSANGTQIKNLFNDGDMNLYQNKGDNSITYMTRSSWITSTPANEQDHIHFNLNQEMVDELLSMTKSTIEKDDGVYPTYEADNHLTLADVIVNDDKTPVDYQDPRWDGLLDELSYEDTAKLISIGMRKTTSIGNIVKPDTIEHNGPTGVTEKYSYGERGLATLAADPDSDYSPTYYPCIGILAATFNEKLAYEVGSMYGEDALWAGYSGLYGIGLNIHRTAYDGREFEYYSEDPLLSGMMAADLVKGLQSKGCNAYVKHLAVYEQQANRVGLTVWVNEQTLREIYLKPFQLAIEKGNARNCMASYTRIGLTYCASNENLLEEFLKKECGLSGFVVTDMWANRYINEQYPSFVFHGCDLPDGDIDAFNLFAPYKEGYSALAWKMREAAHRILYATSQSNAMNGISSHTTIRYYTPQWKIALNIIDIVTSILFGLSVVGLVVYEVIFSLRLGKNS